MRRVLAEVTQVSRKARRTTEGRNCIMKCSVLMSVYKKDDAVYLRQALTSIYDDQTVKPDEIVVVFDGPLTAELYEVLNEFRCGKEDIVFYYSLDTNKGLGEALRVGTEHCTGDYIFRMDADDISHRCRLEKQLAFVEANPQVDIVGTDIAEFYETPDEGNLRIRSCPAAHADIVTMGKKRNPMNHVTVCIKKSALLMCGGYESLPLLEDYYLWVKMISAGCTFANIHEELVYVRIGNGFHSKRGSKVRIAGWKTLQNYMVENKLINKADAFANMLYIRMFTYCPAWLRKVVYDKILRK